MEDAAMKLRILIEIHHNAPPTMAIEGERVTLRQALRALEDAQDALLNLPAPTTPAEPAHALVPTPQEQAA
jgi:hypothetical protein